MVSRHFIEPLAKGYLLMTNILSAVHIDELNVPEVIASDSGAALECMYGGAGGDATVRWLLNGSQVYEWTQGREPSVSGLLEDRADLSYRSSAPQVVQKHTLRIMALAPELSGDYTCAVQSRGHEARMTKTMIVYSPEQEFELTVSPAGAELAVKCVAKHLHPQPELTIEYNKIPISQQQQHIWRVGTYYDAECTAVLSAPRTRGGEVACRLRLPLVDYTAITNKYVHFGKLNSGGWHSFPRFNYLVVTFCMIFLYY